jgi:glutamate-1-semialdehyde 2,1-aminomutase
MNTYSYSKNIELLNRAKQVIPNGIYGHLSQKYLIPNEAYPFFGQRASGAYFWDVDGNKFLDYMCAFGPNILGHNDPDVDNAAWECLKQGDCTTKPSVKMVEFAELLVDTIDMADWALFAKNGSDVTAVSTLIARHATGRRKQIMVKGSYHAHSPWAQSLTNKGISHADVADNIYVGWNDISQIEKAIQDNKGEVACLMATPYYHPNNADNEYPTEGYWQAVRKLCDDNGIVLIIDDIRCGFRMDMGGTDKYFGFKADLLCLCKTLANGWAVSSICGIDSLKESAESVFYTGSYWTSSAAFAAGIACINKLKRTNAIDHMERIGKLYTEGLVDLAKSHNYKLIASGHPSLFYLRHDLGDSELSSKMHQQFIAECVRRGVYLTSYHNMFTSYTMTEEDVKFSLDVADEAYRIVKAQL